MCIHTAARASGRRGTIQSEQSDCYRMYVHTYIRDTHRVRMHIVKFRVSYDVHTRYRLEFQEQYLIAKYARSDNRCLVEAQPERRTTFDSPIRR